MIAFRAKFVKKNGDERVMMFVKLSDLPKEFLNEQVKGTGKVRSFSDGKELVWDLDKAGFRVFDWNTIVGKPEAFEFVFPPNGQAMPF